MRVRTIPAVLAAVLTLSACGGGSQPPAAGATPAAAVERLRLRALAVAASAVAPAEAARQLMDFGEAQFPQYFPSRPATQSFGPFQYRHYAESGIYLGVVVQQGQGYEYLGVYVMGGPFGDAPQFVGPLASFITPVDSGPGPTGVSNGCYDVMLATGETAGTWLVQVRQLVLRLAVGESTTTQTLELVVTGAATFEGHAAMETRQREAEGVYTDGIPDGTPNLVEYLNYDRRTGAAEVTYYGNTGTSTRVDNSAGTTITTTSTGRAVPVPPRALNFYSLPLGGSTTISTTYHYHSSTTTTVGNQAPLTTVTDTQEPSNETNRFVRRESITVPAGTFQACVFETTTPDDPQTTVTEWVADGRGFPLKRVSVTQGVTMDSETTLSLRFNGHPVTN